MSVYTKMAQEECLKTIRKYDTDELIKFVTKHGCVDFCDVLKTREITGEQFVSLKEFEVSRWKLTIPQRRQLWSFIVQVQEKPETFFPKMKPEARLPNTVKKTTQHQNTKEKLELVIGMKTPSEQKKKPEVATLPKPVKKPLPKPPPSPPAEDYLVMEKPQPPPPLEEFYDMNGYLLPVQRTPEVEETNYDLSTDFRPLLPTRTPISERKPLALPREVPPESPTLLPRIVNKPSPDKKIVINQKKPLPEEPEETYETAPNVPDLKKQESEEEDDTYEPVPNSTPPVKEETSKTSFTKFFKILTHPFEKKSKTTTKKSSKEENDLRPLPPLPKLPAIVIPDDGEENNFYENTEDVKNGSRSPSPNVIYTNAGVEVVKNEKPARRKTEEKNPSFQRNAQLSASFRSLPGTSPPRRIFEEKFSPLRSKPIPIRSPSPEIIYTNELIQESFDKISRRLPNSNLPPTPDETPSRTDSSEAVYTNTETEEIQKKIKPVIQRSNTPPISKTEESTSSSNKLNLPPGPYEHYFGNNMKPLPKPPNTPPQLILNPKEMLSEVCDSDSEGEYQQFSFNINNEPFYRSTDRKGARLLLKNLEDGAFLFRPSKTFYLSLSVKQGGKYYNLGIDKTEKNRIRLSTVNNNLCPEFATLDDLASYFTREELSFTSDGQIITTLLKKILPPDVF